MAGLGNSQQGRCCSGLLRRPYGTSTIAGVLSIICGSMAAAHAPSCSAGIDSLDDISGKLSESEVIALAQLPVGESLLQVQSVRHERSIVHDVQQLLHTRDFETASLWHFIDKGMHWSNFAICGAVLALCVFVGALKYGLDYYEEGNVSRPWYTSEFMQLKVGLSALGMWIAVGMLVFTQLVHFNTSSGIGGSDRMLSVIEATYLCAQILTTVGYGDYTPSRPEGQLFVASFILIGVVVIAVVVTELLKVVMRRGERAVAKAVGLKGVENFDQLESSVSLASASLSDINESEQSQALASHVRVRDNKRSRKNFVAFMLSVGPFLLCLLVGTLFYTLFPGENKSVWQAFYMSCITLTSVGFGTFTPKTKGGELFASVWMLVGVGATANMIVSFGDWFFYSRSSLQAYHLGNELLAEMDADHSGYVDKCEYLRFELIRCGLCHKEDVDMILFRYKMLDPSSKGIPVNHLREIHEEPTQRMRSTPSHGVGRQLSTGVFFSRMWSNRGETPAANAG